MVERKTVYIAGKLTGHVKENTERAIRKGAELAKQGYAPIIPHANLSGIGGYEDFTYDEYLRIDFAHIKKADTVYMLGNWRDSHGARREERYARLLHKEIIYEPMSFKAKSEDIFNLMDELENARIAGEHDGSGEKI